MKPRLRLALFLIFAALSPALLAAQMPKQDVIEVAAIGEGLCVSNVFQSNMVLQRDKPVPIWGWAAPGESVTVTFGKNSASATAGADRGWKITLPAMPANATPQCMTVKGANKFEGGRNVHRRDQ